MQLSSKLQLNRGAYLACKGGWKVKAFAKLFAQEPAFEYHYNKMDMDFQIINFTKPSQQNRGTGTTRKKFYGLE